MRTALDVEPRIADLSWTVLAVVVGGVTAAVVVGRLWVFARTEPSFVLGVVGLVITLLQTIFGYWIVAGSWRRTVWGCRLDPRALHERTCPRHGTRCVRASQERTTP